MRERDLMLTSGCNIRILNNLFEKSGMLQQHFQFPGYKWH
ncbi:hypothetical protein T03_15306 [Trichinella britovi]|uniref:Uncharacterized protein n=1 Tax=Trichinella britovi TaxID=45882 RepID=A0A0V1AIA3_TRIBR|nr:hypothetical protein T03_15306 [Trichinella britovi]